MTQRPIPDIDKVLASMKKVIKDKNYRESIAQKGYDFATEYTWERIVNEWSVYFTKKEIPFLSPMEMEVIT